MSNTMPHLTNVKLIGITGPAGCGKDTLGRLITTMDSSFSCRSFAEPMKTMLSTGLLLTDEQLHGNQKETVDPTYECSPRHMMQTLGTEWGRNHIHPDVWVTALKAKWEADGCPPTVLTDVRFENEAEFVRYYGTLIHIVGRGGIDGDHISEQGITKQPDDWFIRNTGSIEDLNTALKNLNINNILI